MLTPQTIVGIILLCVAAVFILIAIIGFICDITGLTYGGGSFTGFVCFILGAIVAAFPLVGFGAVGWSPDYLTFHTVSGNVEQIASRQIASGHGSAERYVVVIAGQPYAIDDTRAALLKTGDRVTLNCTREFEWGSTNNGYECNWG